MGKKLTIEYVRSKMVEVGYELLSDIYINNRTKLIVRCDKGHTYLTSWNNFRQGCRCHDPRAKKTIEEVRAFVESIGYYLVSTEYVNSRAKMITICSRGHIYYINWDGLNAGDRCSKCDDDKRKGENCHLWKGGVTKLDIILYDTFAHQIDWCEEVRRDPDNKDWLQVRCTNCNEWFMPTRKMVNNRITAVNNINKGACRFYCSEECKHSCSIYRQVEYPRDFKSDYHRHPDYTVWAKMIKERDNYECQICGETEGINAHHYEGLHVNDMQSLDLDMGVTLCAECHHRSHTRKGCTYYDLQKRNVCKQKQT